MAPFAGSAAELRATVETPWLERIAAGSADDIRAQGWAVAVHNDYRVNGEPHTFWLFTQGDRCVKGEGRSDAEALEQVRAAIAPRPAAPAQDAA